MVYRKARTDAKRWLLSCLAGAYAVPRGMQNQAATRYELPANTFMDWRGCERYDFVPTPRQQLVVDAVQKALDAGNYFTKDVLEFCKQVLQVSEAQASVAVTRVEGGEVGMDLYYARKYLGKQKELQEALAVVKLLQPHVGQQLGTIMFTDYKRITGAFIAEVSADSLSMTVQGKRGHAVVAFSCNPLSIVHAIDRAAGRGQRKTNFVATYGAAERAGDPKGARASRKAPADELTASLF